jgi:hypothetical protein
VETAISEITALIQTVRRIGIGETTEIARPFRLKPLFADDYAPWNE